MRSMRVAKIAAVGPVGPVAASCTVFLCYVLALPEARHHYPTNEAASLCCLDPVVRLFGFTSSPRAGVEAMKNSACVGAFMQA